MFHISNYLLCRYVHITYPLSLIYIHFLHSMYLKAKSIGCSRMISAIRNTKSRSPTEEFPFGNWNGACTYWTMKNPRWLAIGIYTYLFFKLWTLTNTLIMTWISDGPNHHWEDLHIMYLLFILHFYKFQVSPQPPFKNWNRPFHLCFSMPESKGHFPSTSLLSTLYFPHTQCLML